MELLKRMSDYDLFGYLPQGFLLLAACDYLTGANYFLVGATWDVPKGILVFFAAYIAGHMAASPASKILERWLAVSVLGSPAFHLLSSVKAPGLTQVFFEDYFTPLSEPVRAAVLEKLGRKHISRSDGQKVFWIGYLQAKRDEHAKDRMATFLNLYGFCRNVSFIAGLTSFLLLFQSAWSLWVGGHYLGKERLIAALVLATVSLLMFQRFLKFFRLYSVEVLGVFASSATSPLVHLGTEPV